jgi:hypothetical protein
MNDEKEFRVHYSQLHFSAVVNSGVACGMSLRNKRNLALLWRGALAGALGGPLCLLGVALVEKLRLGYVSYGGALEILAIPTFLLVGAVYGTVVALILWILTLRNVYPPAVIRAMLGALVPLLFVTILNVARSGENTGITPPTLMEAAANAVIYCTAFGALPGLAARPKEK